MSEAKDLPSTNGTSSALAEPAQVPWGGASPRSPAWSGPARVALAVMSGLLLGASQPIVIESLGDNPIDPTGLTGLLALIGYVPLLLAVQGAGPKRAFWLAFITHLLQLTIVLHWLLVAMTVFGRIPFIGSFLLLLLLTSVGAAYLSSAFAIARIIVGRFGFPSWIVVPVCVCGIEFLRNNGPLGGFPWGNIGNSFATVPLFLQLASVVGVYGLVFCALAVSSALTAVIGFARGGGPFPRGAVILGSVVLALWVLVGVVRLSAPDDQGKVVRVGLLQGNVELGIRNKTETPTGKIILARYQELTRQALDQGAKLLVWPEASFPLRLKRDRVDVKDIGLIPDDRPAPDAVVVGTVAFGSTADPVTKRKREQRHNSAFIVDKELQVRGRVDKVHLVPFGEYVPWPLGKVVQQIVPIGGTVPGSDFVPTTLNLGGSDVSVGVTICYEGIFPEISRAFAKAGAELMVNITNDSWYGISSAAKQHMLMYAVRAVESGRPVVRAANTGISGFVDTRGRMHDLSAIFVSGAVVADVPVEARDTVYVWLGEWVALPCSVLMLSLWLFAMLGPGFFRRQTSAALRALGVVGAVVAASAVVFWFATGAARTEATATQALVGVAMGLVVSVGSFSGRRWGRNGTIACGGVLVVSGGIGTVVGAPVVGAIALAVGVGLIGFAVRMRAAYTSPRAPLRHLDR